MVHEMLRLPRHPDDAMQAAADKKPKAGESLIAELTLPLFIILSCIAVPNIFALIVTKSVSSFAALASVSYYPFIRTVLWVLVPLAATCGVVYIVKSRDIQSRLFTGMALGMLVAGFAAVMR